MQTVRVNGTDAIDLRRPAHAVAPDLLGWHLSGVGAGGRIVEVEAYEPDDEASHSFRGPTARNAVMFGPPGRLYVYLIYGIHLCANVVVGPEGRGSAVLIRAVEPVIGQDVMAARRGTAEPRSLGSGPGKVCQALGITRDHDGVDLFDPDSPIRILPPDSEPDRPIRIGPRIGISKAKDRPWRFGFGDSPHLSRRFTPSG